MKRIGILCGTFNPVHIGHLAMAEVAYEKLVLDKVIFIPSYLPPDKSSKNVIASGHRYQMVRLATQGNSRLGISDFEVKRKRKSYSIDTVTHLKHKYPKGTKLFFIIGSDRVATLHTWKRIHEILKVVSFVVINRPGFRKGHPRISVRSVTMPALDVSSSYARRQIRENKTVKYLIPENVLKYIRKHKLYQTTKK